MLDAVGGLRFRRHETRQQQFAPASARMSVHLRGEGRFCRCLAFPDDARSDLAETGSRI
jgi:hypothetical protein